MKAACAVLALFLFAGAANSQVIEVKGENITADVSYLQRQKQILQLYVGLKHSTFHSDECGDFDFQANTKLFKDPAVVTSFLQSYKSEYNLPRNGIFTLFEPRIRTFTLKLFDVLYFANDFDTFYKVACWARNHVEPVLFNYVYTLALYHREDCRQFTVPPLYEVFPDYFLPQDAIQEIYNNRILGNKELQLDYSNTGYEFNYNTDSFGGLLDFGNHGYQSSEYRISYFREDVGLNNYYLTWTRSYPGWMANPKYGKSWFRRGEGFYYTHQQLLARYTLERTAHGLPYVNIMKWDKPIEFGYNSRISHLGGQPFIPRPDHTVPTDSPNVQLLEDAETYYYQVIDAVNFNGLWNQENDTIIHLDQENGIDILGKMIYGASDSPNNYYYGTYYYKALQTLSNVAQYKNNFIRNSGIISCPFTTLRDPLFYDFLAHLVNIMQTHAGKLPHYTRKELEFPGVAVKDVEFDKLLTFFEKYSYSVSNVVPLKNMDEFKDLKYSARQFRLNHKPYNYKLTVDSDSAHDGMVRVFLGPKYDSENHELTLQQRRLAMFEIDRFPIKLKAGKNVFERNSQDSPIFTQDWDSIKTLEEKIQNALNKTEEFHYYKQKVTCGMPDRFQLPKGSRAGRPYVITVVVSPFTKRYDGADKEFYTTCGSSELYDYRALGFPFDRKIRDLEFDVQNIFTKDVNIYHKTAKQSIY